MNHKDAHSRFASVQPIEAVSDALVGAACSNAATPRAQYLGPLTVTAPQGARTHAFERQARGPRASHGIRGRLTEVDVQEPRRREREEP